MRDWLLLSSFKPKHLTQTFNLNPFHQRDNDDLLIQR